MIARLTGRIVENEGSVVVLDVHGVGYAVAVPESVGANLPDVGAEVMLLTRQIFREDGVSLYGFATASQRRVFDALLEVKGCGPKVALALIGQVGEHEVAHAIARQDAKALTRATGVGVRLAERILVELKDKLAPEAFPSRSSVRTAKATTAVEDELVDALLTLGYRRADAEIAAERARGESEDLQTQLRAALRLLQK